MYLQVQMMKALVRILVNIMEDVRLISRLPNFIPVKSKDPVIHRLTPDTGFLEVNVLELLVIVKIVYQNAKPWQAKDKRAKY